MSNFTDAKYDNVSGISDYFPRIFQIPKRLKELNVPVADDFSI